MTAMQDHPETVESTRARIAEWCAWFDIAPPKLKHRKGSIYITNELCQWLRDSGASFDWILYGDAKEMASAFRRGKLAAFEIEKVVSRFDDTELALILKALAAHRSGEITFDEALAKFQADITAYRAAQHGMGGGMAGKLTEADIAMARGDA